MGKLKQRLKNGLTNLLVAPLFISSSGCIEELQYTTPSTCVINSYYHRPSERFATYRYYDPLTKININDYYDSLHWALKGTPFEPSKQTYVLKTYVEPRHRFNNPCLRNYGNLNDSRMKHYYHYGHYNKHRRH